MKNTDWKGIRPDWEPKLFIWLLILLIISATLTLLRGAELDNNGNGLGDVWELVHGPGLMPGADTDADGYTNLQESKAGTNPRDGTDFPALGIAKNGAALALDLLSVAGKNYTFEYADSVAGSSWTAGPSALGDGDVIERAMELGNVSSRFFRLRIEDIDTDGDGLNDFEEASLGYNPATRNSDRFAQTDLQRANAGMVAANTINISALDPLISERWPDPGLVVIRRKSGLAPLTINLSFGGTATAADDYKIANATQVFLPAGAREAWVTVHPVADSLDSESTETITVTLAAGTGYTLGTNTTATLFLANETATSGPSAKETARFLIQAVFGPDQDSADDEDYIPENVEEVMAMGFAAWIDDQFTRPVGKLQPFVEWAQPVANDLQLYGDLKKYSWWARAMGHPTLRPDAVETVLPDPLRQRLGFSLSQILVISDRLEDLAVEPVGMANFYDMLLGHAFGNYHDLLFDVAMHPCMGIYLSHVGNRKADLVNRVYPDENFAREIMQLFSIGLWELNQDGSRKLDPQGQPIPTYNNDDITELARVFTGIGFGGTNVNFGLWPRDFTKPMKVWDEHHDLGPKQLLRGLQLPQRTASLGNTGTAGLADVRAAVSNLFHHPNVGPFLGKQLIQRFVTSNPSTNYIFRVAGAFNNNGSGVRGDLKAVIKAILLDPEARDPQMMQSPTFGKLREPFLRAVNFARAFNATSQSGVYALNDFMLDHNQEPFSAPSVFNFFLPAHSPPGPITEAGLVAPEFQIINASTSVAAPNYFWNSINGDLARWGTSNPTNSVRLNLHQEMRMVVPDAVVAQDVPNVTPFDPDPLLRRLDLALTGGTLSPRQFQIIRETLERIPRPTWQWHREYLRVAIYLVIATPEFSVLK